MYYSYEYGNVYVLIMYMFVGGYGSVRCPVRCRDSLLFSLCIGSLLHSLKKARESCAMTCGQKSAGDWRQYGEDASRRTYELRR
jgi:hypothetical protein